MRIPSLRPELRDHAIQSDRSQAPAAGGKAAVQPLTAAQPPSQAAGVLQALPEVDLDKVAAVRAALARGEISFDADKLAATIAAYHRG